MPYTECGVEQSGTDHDNNPDRQKRKLTEADLREISEKFSEKFKLQEGMEFVLETFTQTYHSDLWNSGGERALRHSVGEERKFDTLFDALRAVLTDLRGDSEIRRFHSVVINRKDTQSYKMEIDPEMVFEKFLNNDPNWFW